MPDRQKAEIGPGAVRGAVVWDAVHAVLDELADHPLTIVDVGGGTGGLAVRVADLGHQVTVIDPSPDALASLRRRAEEAGVAHLVRGIQGDAVDLGDYVDTESTDLVLCHGVLDVLDQPSDALHRITDALRPGGVASVVVSGRPAGVLAKALAGQFDKASAMLDARVDAWDFDEHGTRRFTAAEFSALLTEHRLQVDRIDAVRVFSDLLPSMLIDSDPGGRRALLELERAVATRPEYSALAAQLHAVARRG